MRSPVVITWIKVQWKLGNCRMCKVIGSIEALQPPKTHRHPLSFSLCLLAQEQRSLLCALNEQKDSAYHIFDSISSISVSDTIPPCVHTLFCPGPSQSLPKQVNLSRFRVAQGGRVDMGAFRGQRTIFRQSTCTDIKMHSPVSLGPCISKKTVSQPLPDYGYFN